MADAHPADAGRTPKAPTARRRGREEEGGVDHSAQRRRLEPATPVTPVLHNSGAGTKVAKVSRDAFEAGLESVKDAIRRQIALDKEFVLMDGDSFINTDADLQGLRYPAALHAVVLRDGQMELHTKERVSFPPHPKTMTMAGDYEYFAAQGQHPFAFALAELIDNSIRALKSISCSYPTIKISLVVDPVQDIGLICVRDNGCGMTKNELKDWAVMNLSMEDKGLQAGAGVEMGTQRGEQGGGVTQFMTGNLSHFGVGSKNAAFFLGHTIKVVTKQPNSRIVHELTIDGEALEARYRNNEPVYESDMVHREPGDDSTLLPGSEDRLEPCRQWVTEEVLQGSRGEVCGNGEKLQGDKGKHGGKGDLGGSFTRVVVTNLKDEAKDLLLDEGWCGRMCHTLAHMYHYYIHGDRDSANKVTMARHPHIKVEYIRGGQTIQTWPLAELEDMETKYLKNMKSSIEFKLHVPDRGLAIVRMWYFPFLNERETLPEAVDAQMPMTRTCNLTQDPGTQLSFRESVVEEGSLGEDCPAPQAPQRPMFEAFWQCRLIPAAGLDTLPFIDRVRMKRGAREKEKLPDEVFNRVRGALFFGPLFKVTRNKLMFRDNLRQLLDKATSIDRNIDKKFQNWLVECHKELDKPIMFSKLQNAQDQDAARKELETENITSFERISDGHRTVKKGDIVRMNSMRHHIGRVNFFYIEQAVKSEGAYAQGSVSLSLLPEEIHGPDTRVRFHLSRLDTVLSKQQVHELVEAELAKTPSSLCLEDPMSLTTHKNVRTVAGGDLPATSISVQDGHGKKITAAFFGGRQQKLKVIQRLVYLGDDVRRGEGADEGCRSMGSDLTNSAGGSVGSKRKAEAQRGGDHRKRKRMPGGHQNRPGVEPAEIVLENENETPNKKLYQFRSATKHFQRAGRYCLVFELKPIPPGREPLRLSVNVVVKAGPPERLSIQGNRDTLVSSRPYHLGEHLPPLVLKMHDTFGNEVKGWEGAGKEATLRVVNRTAERVAQLIVEGRQESMATSLHLLDTHILPVEGARLTASLFSHSQERMPVASPSKQGQAASTSSQAGTLPSKVNMLITVDGLPAKVVPISLLPGAPQRFDLVDGHPFGHHASGSQGEGPPENCTVVTSGEALQEFQVQAVDAWGNPTMPSHSLAYAIEVQSDAILGSPKEFKFSKQGVATVTGLVVKSPGDGNPPADRVPLCIGLTGLQGDGWATDACKDFVGITCHLMVEMSRAPHSLRLLHNCQVLPMVAGEEEEGPAALLSGVLAGGAISGLCLLCVDEGGRPADTALAAKVSVSWSKKRLKCKLEGKAIPLPEMVAPSSVHEALYAAVQLKCAPGPSGSLDLRAHIRVESVPAAPAKWVVGIAEREGQDPTKVMCGEPFAVDIEAVDEHGNRCARGMVAATPTVWPEVVGGTPGKTGALVFCPGDWDCAWEQTQSGEDFFRITLSIAGPVGPIRLVVGDADGTGGSSLLLKDSLDVDLLAGPPHELMVEGPRQVRCSTQGAFGPLKIRLLDKWHNHVTDHKPFEVVLNPFALGGEEGGQAAKVSAKKHRGNRLTMTKGMATCEEVQLQAAEPGQYRVRVASTSKRLVLMDATMVVQAENTNRVVSLKLSEPSFNPNCVAGGCAALKVLVSTDDGEPLPQEAANTGLSLILTGPDDDTMRLPPLPGHAQSSQPSPSAAAFKFRTEMLNVAGAYKAVAEYVESREALLRFIGCERLRKVESVECTFEIGVGPPMRAEVYCDGMERRLADSPSVTGSNGDAVEDRRLLRNVTIAVHDRFRNPTPTTGLDVSVHLQMKDNVPPGCVLPSLTTDPSQCAVATDQQGRIELGDLVLEAGSGKVPEDSGSSALELRLVFSVGGLRDDEGRRMPLTDVLEVNVLFSDGAACSSILRSASQRMHGVEKRKAELDKQLRAAKNAADKARKQHQGTVRAVEHERQGIHGTVPASISELRMHLDSLADRWNRQQASQPALDAAFGDPRDPQTVAVQHCLLARDPDVVGVFAQLGTVTDQRLAAVLAAACGKSLRILVVRNFQCHERLIAELDKQCLGVPAMLPMDGVRKFYTEQREAQLQMQMTNQSALSAKLHEDACAGADEPLALLLPHTLAAMKRRKGETSSYKLPPTSYPDGFVGFMCNLIRPAVQGHRSSVFWSMLNRNAVFETMKQAHAYRRYVTQTLKLPVPMTVFTLDGKKLDSRGVIEGSDWKVQPLKDARLRFGTTPPQQSVDVLMATQHLGELRRLLAAMEEEEQAGNEAAAAAKAHQDLREEVQRVKEELATERDKLKQHLKIEKSR